MIISLSKNAMFVLEKRYLKKDSNGNIVETPEELFARVAKSIAVADKMFDPKADVNKTEKNFYAVIDQSLVYTQLSNPYECRKAPRTVGRLFCSSCGRFN